MIYSNAAKHSGEPYDLRTYQSKVTELFQEPSE